MEEHTIGIAGSTTQEMYGSDYYSNYWGSPAYSRDEPHWVPFFAGVANRIVSGLKPVTVLDAGCAIGFLVEALRNLGVQAFGFDYSEYAISQVPEKFRPFVKTGSLTEPIEGRYDLVTCIEVIEHLSAADASIAVKNLCNASDTVLFSSTYGDFEEPTHLNVQPPYYWSRLFAENGFVRDMRIDASFVSAWAVVYRRESIAPPDLVERFERELDLVSRERNALRADLLSRPTQRATDTDKAVVLVAEVSRLEAELATSRQEVLLAVDSAIGAERAAGHSRAELEELNGRLASAEHQLALIAGIGAELQALRNDRAYLIAENVNTVVKKIRRSEKKP